jgi:hypothetical protein
MALVTSAFVRHLEKLMMAAVVHTVADDRRPSRVKHSLHD